MLIHKLTLRGLLSFGPDSQPIDMQPLNVLIGPNGSGKSNIIEALALLRSAPTRLTAPLRGQGGGGVSEWIWKGGSEGCAHIEALIDNPRGHHLLRHAIRFAENAARFELVDEAIENEKPDLGEQEPYFYYRYQEGRPVLNIQDGHRRSLQREQVSVDESILSQRKDPDQYPELGYLSGAYSSFRLYREWAFGRTSVFRNPQPADMPGDRLEEDFSNLGLYLNQLRAIPRIKNTLLKHLRDLYDNLLDFDVRIRGGAVEVFFTEGDFTIPASRLSDGTLRYLCLLGILCDPNPPSLICIEEPELGLHPSILPKVAELLVDASERTQLVVTTHSDILVDALTDHPEAVVVVEKHNAQTVTKRLMAAEVAPFLENYGLGQLWLDGQVGGIGQ